jgi:hypothetical protein
MNISDEYTVYGDPYNDKDTFILIGFEKYDCNINIINVLIALFTKSKYVHTEIIYIEHGRLVMMSASQYSDNVRKRWHKLNTNWEYYRMKVDEKFISNMLEFFKIVKHCKYDYLGILGFILFNKDRSDKWFCSEFVSNILKINSYKPMWCLEPSEISPGKLGNLLNIDSEDNRLNILKKYFKSFI